MAEQSLGELQSLYAVDAPTGHHALQSKALPSIHSVAFVGSVRPDLQSFNWTLNSFNKR